MEYNIKIRCRRFGQSTVEPGTSNRGTALWNGGNYNTMNRKSRKSATSTYLILVTMFLLVVNASLGFLLMWQSSTTMIRLMERHMLDISNTAADMLDGDVLEKVTEADKGTEGYQRIMNTLTYFQNNIDLKYIYCIRDMGDGTFTFGLDPTVEDPGEFGSPITYTPALQRASQGVASADDKPYQDAWGTFYSAYSPVFNSKGAVAGIVAVDFSAEWYEQHLASLTATTAIVAGLSLAIGIGIVLVISARSRRKLQEVHSQLYTLAENVEKLVRAVGSMSDTQSAEEDAPEAVQYFGSDDIDSLGQTILGLQDELSRQITRIHELAYHDGLTGVRNKTAYLETVRFLDGLIEKGTAVFSVAVFDLNGLKNINDNYGHECGDMALKDAANVLVQVFEVKNVYRIGGDEYIAILKNAPDTDMEQCFARMDAIIADFNKVKQPYQLPLGLSKGYAYYEPGNDSEFRAVFKRADLMMYKAKAEYYMRTGDRRRRT